MDYLSLCLICKDENDYLPEWLDYHIMAGVDRFYIFDNGSAVPLRETLEDYIRRGWTVVEDFPGKSVQLRAYDACLQVYGSQSRWIGFIDTDEFLVPKTGQNLKALLREYEDFGGLAVSSLFFGSNQHKSRPLAGQIASYTRRTHATFFENTLIKSIVQPDRVLVPKSPHDFIYKENSWCVNEGKHRVDFQRFPNSIERIQLNHYFCRSEGEIEAKLRRGRGDAGEPWKRLRFDLINQRSTEEDLVILDLIGQICKQPAGAQLAETGRDDPRPINVILHSLADARNAVDDVPKAVRQVQENPLLDLHEQLSGKVREAEDRGDYAEAKRLQLELINAMPHRASLFVDLGICCLELNDAPLAWQALAEAWQRAPNSFLVMRGMAFYFLRVKNYEMAEKMCALLFAIAPHDLTVMGFLTEALIGLGRMEEALNVGIPLVGLSATVGELPQGMVMYLLPKMTAYLEEKRDYRRLAELWEARVASQPEKEDFKRELARVRKLAGRSMVAAPAKFKRGR